MLRRAYLYDTSNATMIKRGNIALLSDMNFGFGIIKGVARQAKANNKGDNLNRHRNTFFLRFPEFEAYAF